MEISQLLKMMGQQGAAPRPGVSAPNAMQNMQARQAYTQYAIEAQSAGQQPMPFEMWVQMQQGQR